MQLMKENQRAREKDELERQRIELEGEFNGQSAVHQDSPKKKKKTDFYEDTMAKLGDKKRDKTPQEKAEEARNRAAADSIGQGHHAKKKAKIVNKYKGAEDENETRKESVTNGEPLTARHY